MKHHKTHWHKIIHSTYLDKHTNAVIAVRPVVQPPRQTMKQKQYVIIIQSTLSLKDKNKKNKHKTQ